MPEYLLFEFTINGEIQRIRAKSGHGILYHIQRLLVEAGECTVLITPEQLEAYHARRISRTEQRQAEKAAAAAEGRPEIGSEEAPRRRRRRPRTTE